MSWTAGALQNKKGYENGIIAAAVISRSDVWPILKYESQLSYSSEVKLASM